uniref:Uncharacterized protein n=1 Tax=Arundo donax TaxID=35708 RepID=A0A0A9BIY5_ARUDO
MSNLLITASQASYRKDAKDSSIDRKARRTTKKESQVISPCLSGGFFQLHFLLFRCVPSRWEALGEALEDPVFLGWLFVFVFLQGPVLCIAGVSSWES